jgi:hypothetical protein
VLRRWYLMVIAALAGLALAACGGGAPAPDSVSSPPQIRLEAGSSFVEGYQGGYCWASGTEPAVCVDPLRPVFEQEAALQVGQSIHLQLDQPLPDSLTLTLRSGGLSGNDVVSESVPVESSVEWRPAVDPGEYILIVAGKWPQGDASYMFKVALK